MSRARGTRAQREGEGRGLRERVGNRVQGGACSVGRQGREDRDILSKKQIHSQEAETGTGTIHQTTPTTRNVESKSGETIGRAVICVWVFPNACRAAIVIAHDAVSRPSQRHALTPCVYSFAGQCV